MVEAWSTTVYLSESEALLSAQENAFVVIGGFTTSEYGDCPRGLAAHRVNATGELSLQGVLELDNPTWVTQAEGQGLLYVSHSARQHLSAVRLGPDGQLTLVDEIDIGTVNPAHITVDASGDFVTAACFTGGEVVQVGLNSAGGFDAVTHRWPLGGAAPTATRRNRLQSEAEPHQVVPAFDGALWVPDRAQDVVWRLAADAAPEVAATLRPGQGPRHLVVHPHRPYVYLVGELDSSLVTLVWEGGALRPVDTVSTLPRAWFGDSAAAAIDIDPERQRVYVSNRGHDSVAVFSIRDPERPMLEGWISVEGETPRYAGVLPALDWFAIAAQGSDRVDFLRGGAAAMAGGERRSVAHAAPSCVIAVRAA